MRKVMCLILIMLSSVLMFGCKQEVKTPTNLEGKIYKFQTIYFESYEWLDASEEDYVKERLQIKYSMNTEGKSLTACLNALAQKETQTFAAWQMELHFQDDGIVQVISYNSRGERDRDEGVYILEGDEVIIQNRPYASDEFYYVCKISGKYLDFYTNYEDDSYGHSWWSLGQYVKKHTMFVMR